jgi:phosphoribosylanthranilate isomerase
MIRLGVDHVGSVLLVEEYWKNPTLHKTVDVVRRLGAKSSLIPLFHRKDSIARAIDYYRPDIVHFCDMLEESDAGKRLQYRWCELQVWVRDRFPEVKIMRSIPIPKAGGAAPDAVYAAARRFEGVSDFFLTDTLMPPAEGGAAAAQPVFGYVGITGKTCDWEMARELVCRSTIPVVLAGGISPENVEAGIAAVRPAGVDSCTCTNAVDADGNPIRFHKDPERVRRLVEAVRRAEKRLQAQP